MRPRLNAGDDEALGVQHLGHGGASMRPRLNAGDDALPQDTLDELDLASMRPRLNAGDDEAARTGAALSARCFNEAPAKCRG